MNKNNKTSLLPSETNSISDIEKIVDKILEDNKDKLKNIEIKNNINRKIYTNKQIGLKHFDARDFSPEKGERESIYFVREKTTEKKPHEISEKTGKTTEELDSSDKKTAKKFTFLKKKRQTKSKTKKKEEETDKKSPDQQTVTTETKDKEDRISSDKDPMLVGQLSEDETKWLDKRIGEILVSKDNADTEIGVKEKKAIEPEKKHPFSDEKKISETDIKKKEEKEIDKKSSDQETFPTDNLAGLERREKEYRIFYSRGLDRTEEFRKDKPKFLDEPDGKTPVISDHAESKKTVKLTEERPSDKKTKKKDKMSYDLRDSKPIGMPLGEEKDLEYSGSDETKLSGKDQHSKPLMAGKDSLPSSKPEAQPIKTIDAKGKIEFSKEMLHLKSAALQKLGFSEEKWEELDFYPLQEPFAYVEIILDRESLDKRYLLIEVELSEEESHVLEFMKESLNVLTTNTDEMESKGMEKYLREGIEQIIEEYEVKLDVSSKEKVIYYLEKQYLGLGIINALMGDPYIEDISCDGANVPIFLYHREYGSLKSNIEFKDEEELSAFVVRLAQKCGKHISIAEPMLDATMPDGSRIQMTLSTEVTAKGSTFTIRKFREDPFSPPDLIEFNTMSAEMVAYMWMAVENGVNALIAGGTAAGKTSTLNALCLFIPRESKIVSIEETREVNLPHPNWIPGVARSGFGEVIADKIVGEIDMYDLMKAALRQRPEYILVGEIRGREAYVLFQAMATGHTTYSTAHADSAQSLIHRLEGKPISIPRIMLQALDIVCIQVTTRVKNKRARRCKQIIEIIDIDPTTKEILTNEVFRWDPIEDKFIYSGKSYVLESIRADKDLSREEMTNEIKNRARLLEWMNNNNIRDFRKVATVLAQYAENPSSVMKKIKDK